MSSKSTESQQRLLTHIDTSGRPSMVNVANKEPTRRTATASGRIQIPKIAHDLISNSESLHSGELPMSGKPYETLQQRKEKARSKGDVLTVAQLAGIMASKHTAQLIPLCHPLALSHVGVNLTLETRPTTDHPSQKGSADFNYSILCRATVSCDGKTGVEMEALTAVSVSLLTVWDMLKAVAGEDMVIGDIYVSSKTGGKSSDFRRHIE